MIQKPGVLQRVNISLIDPPPDPIRQSFDQEGLRSLAESMRQVGVLLPLLVEERDGRYQIHAGHRRYLAASMAGLEDLPVIVYGKDGVDGDAVKLHENVFREDLNPADEAEWFERLLENHCNGDIDQLCAALRMNRARVEDRLLLKQGCPEVFEALREKRIRLGVARELNKVKDLGTRRLFLDAAKKGGASVGLVESWRRDHEELIASAVARLDGSASQARLPTTLQTSLVCLLCGADDEPWDLEMLYVHKKCLRMLDRILKRRVGMGVYDIMGVEVPGERVAEDNT